MKKTLSILLVLGLVFSLFGVSAFAASGEPSAEPAGNVAWQGSSLTVTGVEYADAFAPADGKAYVDSTLFTGVTKILYEGGEIAIDNTLYTPVLTVDGVQVDVYNITEPTTFTGDVVLTLAEKGDSSTNNGAPFGADKAQSSFGPFFYTAAAYVGDGSYEPAKSVPEAVTSGEISDTEANGLTVDSEGDFFSALYINNSAYTVNDARINLKGACGDDFNGWGAGIVVLGSSDVDINTSEIYGTGVLRSGLFTSGNAQVRVNDSVIITENDEEAVAYDTTDNYATPMMQQCPFGLGITGNIRATLACGAGCNTFTNSLVVSNGWAVLSTDSGRSGATALVSNAMVAVVGEASDASEEMPDYDFTYDVNGKPWYVKVGRYGETSGYIAYADSGVLDFAYGSAWYSPDYLGIITSGTITMADNSYGWCGRIGYMLHSGGGGSGTGTLVVQDSSFDVQDVFALAQLKGSYRADVTIDNADIKLANSGSDILYMQVNTDDNAGGPGETHNTVTDLSWDEYLAQEAGEPSGEPSTLLVTNCVAQGNIYNAATSGAPAGLDVTIDAGEVDGEISSAWTRHLDAEGNELEQTEFSLDSYTGTRDGASGEWDYTMYLRLAAKAAPTVNNPVNLTMQNGAKWMVTGTNYLSSLTIDDSSKINGMGLVMTVNGVETEIKAGTYEGEIVLTAGEAPDRGEGDAEMKAPVIGEAAEIAAASAEPEEEFVAEKEVKPFNVEVGDGMVLEFSSVQFATGDGTVSIYIPDTAKLIECVVDGDNWTMEGSDFVDDAIIATAKALYAEDGDAAPAAGGGNWDAWIDYLQGLIDDTIADIADRVYEELEVAQESDYTGMLDGTVFGVFANSYNATPYEEFVG